MKLNKFMQLTKVDLAKKRIYGVFTAEVVDKSGEIADYASTKIAIQEWSADIQKVSGGKSLGNIRKMHSKEAVGKVVELNFDDANKAVHGAVEVDDATLKAAANGVLNGFSIGGSYVKKWADEKIPNATRFTPAIAEISIVDNPCVPDAVFSAIKDASFTIVAEDGKEEMKKFAPKELEGPNEPAQKWVATDGTAFEKKDDAIAHNAKIMADAASERLNKLLEEPQNEAEKRDFTDAERKKAAAEGDAEPDGSYPIKNKDDLHNAIQAYGRSKNKAKTRAHIKAKAKELGATDMLPEKWGKAKDSESLKKGMYSVGRLAQIITELDWLVHDVHFEEAMESDGKSILPEELKAHAKGLMECLNAMVQEETAEMMEDHDCLECAAGITGDQAQALTKVLGQPDLFKAAKFELGEGLQKVTAERDALKKVLDDLPAKVEKKFEALNARIKHLESQPASDKIVLTTVYKGGEPEEPSKETPTYRVPGGVAPSEIKRSF